MAASADESAHQRVTVSSTGAAVDESGWTIAALEKRLAKLTEENAKLSAEAAGWRERASAKAPRDGLFDDCSPTNACVSSQDDRPAVFDNPWVAEEALPRAMERLRGVVLKLKGRVMEEDDRYLRVEFAQSGPLGETVDDAEFYFTPDDVLVQFRAARRDGPDFGANRKRLEKARIALGWEKVEVLRNRRRALVVVESPFDSFGPATYERDELGFTNRDLVRTAPLGPPPLARPTSRHASSWP